MAHKSTRKEEAAQKKSALAFIRRNSFLPFKPLKGRRLAYTEAHLDRIRNACSGMV